MGITRLPCGQNVFQWVPAPTVCPSCQEASVMLKAIMILPNMVLRWLSPQAFSSWPMSPPCLSGLNKDQGLDERFGSVDCSLPDCCNSWKGQKLNMVDRVQSPALPPLPAGWTQLSGANELFMVIQGKKLAAWHFPVCRLGQQASGFRLGIYSKVLKRVFKEEHLVRRPIGNCQNYHHVLGFT